MQETPIINNNYLIQKRIAQSGFKMSDLTYVLISDFPNIRKTGKGSFRVRGFIDTFELKQYNLLPAKEKGMILPLNASVRKKISKKEGDYVQVTLYADESPLEIPEEFLISLLDSPKAHQFFQSLSASNQKYYIDWIENSKKMETKVERVIKTIERLENSLKFYDWINKD
ncbi:MAG: YdeI/OmpD-associated family protein [Bacteroidota bacterium]